MTVAGGYNADWQTVQQDDVTLGGWPRATVHLGEETSNDAEEGTYHQVYACSADVLINIGVKLTTKAANPQYAIDDLLDEAIDDIKRMFGRNLSIGGAGTLPPLYVSCSTPDYATGDVFVTKTATMTWTISYLQSRIEPSQIG
jgi:hypothetical protein